MDEEISSPLIPLLIVIFKTPFTWGQFPELVDDEESKAVFSDDCEGDNNNTLLFGSLEFALEETVSQFVSCVSCTKLFPTKKLAPTTFSATFSF